MNTPTSPLPTKALGGIRYHDGGSSEHVTRNVLLLHGLGNSLDYWTAIAPRFYSTARTIAVDIPGFGKSKVPPSGFTLQTVSDSLLSLLRSLKAMPTLIVAHSMGTYVALKMATEAADEIRGIVLVDGTLFRAHQILRSPTYALANPSLTAVVAAQFIGGLIPITPSLARIMTKYEVVRRLLFWPYLARPNRVDSSLLATAIASNAGTSMVRVARIARRTSISELTAGVGQPVDIIRGRLDRLITAEDVDTYEQLLHVCRATSIPACGHWPMIEQPDNLAAFLIESMVSIGEA